MAKIISMFTRKEITEEEVLETLYVQEELAKYGIVFHGLEEDSKELLNEFETILNYFDK